MRFSVLIVLLLGNFLHAQNGTLKNNFGSQGKLSVDIDDLDHLVGLLKDDQNNTYFYGNTSDYQGGNYPLDIFFGKMDEYGDLDPSFGTNGIVRLDFPGFEKSTINKAAFHNSGIYFIGQGANNSSPDTFALWIGKINLDGSTDLNFAQNGFFTSQFLGTYNTAGSIIIDTDDKVVFCGSTTDDQGTLVEYPLMGRLNLNGDPDSTFGNTGLIVYDYYQDSILDASELPAGQPMRHGDGAYSSELVEINNSYFAAGKFVGISYSQLNVMSITKAGTSNPNFLSSGPLVFQVEAGYNHFLNEIAFNGSKVLLGFETQGSLYGHHLIQIVDTTGFIENYIDMETTGFFMRTKFVKLWNDRLFVGGYHLDQNNVAPGYHSDVAQVYCLDNQMQQIPSFNFNEDLNPNEELGAEDLVLHNSFGIVGGYMNNIVDTNTTDLFFMAFEVNDELSVLEQSNDFKVYPNPTTDFIKSSSIIGTYQLISMSGEVVMEGIADHEIDLSRIDSGTYLLLLDKKPNPIRIIKTSF